MIFKHHAGRFLAFAALALLLAGCANNSSSVNQDYEIGYVLTATLSTPDTPGTAVFEKAGYFSDGTIVTESDLQDLSTQQQYTDAGGFLTDMRRDQLVLETQALTFFNNGVDSAVTVDTTWRNGTAFYFHLPVFGANNFGYRLVDCFIIASGDASRVGNNCDFVEMISISSPIAEGDIARITNNDLGGDREMEPGSVAPPSAAFDFTGAARVGERIRFFVVPTIPASQVCTGTGGTGCGVSLPN